MSRGQKFTLWYSFVSTFLTTYFIAFVVCPEVPYKIGFDSMTSDSRVHCRGWGLRSNSSSPLTLQCTIIYKVFIRILATSWYEAFIL